MDKELKTLLDKARSSGATKEQLQGIVNRYKSKKEQEVKNLDSDFASVDGQSSSESESPEPKTLVEKLNAGLIDTSFDRETVDLYNNYLENTKVTDSEVQEIADKETKPSLWNAIKTGAKSLLQGGMFIPTPSITPKSEIRKNLEEKRRIDFISDLPEKKKNELQEYVAVQQNKLSGENLNALSENKFIEDKVNELITTAVSFKKQYEEAVKNNIPVSEDFLEQWQELEPQVASLVDKHGKNLATIEANDSDISSFEDELDLLKRNYSTWDNFTKKLDLTAEEMYLGVEEFMFDTMESARRTSSDKIIWGTEPLSVSNKRKEYRDKAREAIKQDRELLRPTMSVSDIESVSDFGHWATEQLAQQLPVLTVLATTGGAGLTALGASAAGQQAAELKEDKPEMTDRAIYISSIIDGLAEAGGEYFTRGILNKGFRALKSAPKEGIKQGIKSFVGDVTTEAASEGMTQLLQNANDIYIADKEGVSLTDGMLDVMASGGFFGGGLNALSKAPAVVNKVMEPFKTKENRYILKKNNNKIIRLSKELQKDLPESVKKKIESKLKKTVKENKKIIQSVVDKIESKTSNELKQIVETNKKIQKKRQKGQDIQKSDLDEVVKKSLVEDINKDIDAFIERKESLINKESEGTNINKAKYTQGFFSDVVSGKSKKYIPSKPYEYEKTFSENQESFRQKYDDKKGNFDEHIATSIPTFRDTQVQKGAAITDMYKDEGALIYDLGGSEGGFVKTITEQSQGKIKSINLDPNKKMKKASDLNKVEGHEHILEAFHKGFDDIPAHKPQNKADVVHESMLFQFITPDRKNYIKEIKNNYLKEDGVFITEEKFKIGDRDKYLKNEQIKAQKHKSKYFTEEQQKLKGEDVLVGMDKNQADYDSYIKELKKNFKYVDTYWTSGNFRGVIATDNKVKFDEFFDKLGDTSNEYTYTDKFKQAAEKVRALKFNKTVAESMSQLSSDPTGLFKFAWDSTMETVAKSIEVTGDIKSAIDQGVDYLKTTDWYKGLSKEGKIASQEMFQKEVFNQYNKTLDSKQTKAELNKMLAGVPVLSYIDEKIFGQQMDKVESLVAKKVSEGVKSRNVIVRNAFQMATSFFNGLPRTKQELDSKRALSGKQKLAYFQGQKLTMELQKLINYEAEAAENVHKVLDPELYNEEELFFIDSYDEAQKISYDNLAPNEKELHDLLKKINDNTHELNYKLGFISEETYNKYKDSYIGRGYEVFEDLTDTAEKDLLDNKIDANIYKNRKEINQWKIDNKIKDPIYLTINRMIRTERNVAIMEYANSVNEKHAVDEPQAGFTKLSGKGYGSLDGKYVPNYIAEDFKGYFFSLKELDKIYDFIRWYDKTTPRQFLKRWHTVYNPVVQVGNFMSNHAFAFTAGVNVYHLWKNLPNARKSLKSQDVDYQILLENGIIDSNVLTPDLMLNKEAQKELKLTNKSPFMKFLKKADDKARSLYASSDDVMKMAAYKSLRETGYTQSEAMERVFQGFQNYSTVGKIWDVASKFPVFGNAYIKFQADLMRIIKNAATRRPLSTATFLYALHAGTVLMSRAAGESDEGKDIREARPFIPKVPFAEIPLVGKVGDKEINLARYISPFYEYDIPNKSWIEKVSQFMPFQINEVDAAELGQTEWQLDTPDVLLGAMWAAFMHNKDFRQKSISDPYATRYKESGNTELEKFANKLEYVTRSVVPLYSSLNDLYLTNMYGEDYYGRNKEWTDVVLSKLVKVQTFDDESLKKTIESNLKSVQYKQKIIDNKTKSIQRKYRREAQELNKNLKEGKISSEQRSNKLQKLEKDMLKRMNVQMDRLVKEQEKLNEFIVKVNKLPTSKKPKGF